MMEPRRFKDGDGPVARLIEAAALDVPSAAARRRALATVGASAGTVASASSAAASWSVLAKGVALGCAGALAVGAGVIAASHFVPLTAQVTPSASLVPALGVGSARSAQRSSASPLAAPPAVPTLAAPAEVALPVKAEVGASKAPTKVRGVASAKLVPASNEVAAPAKDREQVPEGSEPQAEPSLFEELHVIESARALFSLGDLEGTLRVLDTHARTYPAGKFRPEAMALRVQSLARRGELSRAQALALEFERQYPQHPLLTRVRAAVGP